jgi:hypothetical protein
VGALRSAARHARENSAHGEAAQLLRDALELAEKMSEADGGARVREIREEMRRPVLVRKVAAVGS